MDRRTWRAMVHKDHKGSDTTERLTLSHFTFRGHLTCAHEIDLSSATWPEKAMHPTPVLLPGKSHGRRSLVGCSPWRCEESDTTERLYFHFSLSCLGEGNGNPLQCSCLENPRDGGAWWAAVYGVTQSRTWLKWLSLAAIWQQLISFFLLQLSAVMSITSLLVLFPVTVLSIYTLVLLVSFC